MSQIQIYAAPAARILLSLIFIVSGLAKLGDVRGAAAYIQSGGLPGFLVYPTIALEIVGGLFVAVGFRARETAFLLAGFALLTGILFHFLPAQGLEGFEQMNHFFKNVAIAGGFFMILSLGAGPFSADGRRQKA